MPTLTLLTRFLPVRRADIAPPPVAPPVEAQCVPLALSAADWMIVAAARSDSVPASAYLFTPPVAAAKPVPAATPPKATKAKPIPSIGSAAKVKRVGTGYHVTGQLAGGQVHDLGVNAQAKGAFDRMRQGAAVSGIVLTEVYDYRSMAEQRRLWRASDRSGRWVARPGHSEHHTGLAFDINTTTSPFGKSPAYRWMKQHAWEYGFVQSMGHEPWHWRYDPEAVRLAVARSTRKR